MAPGPWQVEGSAIPESVLVTAGALRQVKFMLGGVEVDPQRMRSNLDLTGGLIVSEAVMMGLSPHLGRQVSHDLVYDACRSAMAERCPLADVLAREPRISAHLDRAAIDRLCEDRKRTRLNSSH